MPRRSGSRGDLAVERALRARAAGVDALAEQRRAGRRGRPPVSSLGVVDRAARRHQALVDRERDLRLGGGDAHGRGLGEVGVLGVGADADVDAADRGLGLLALDRLRVARPAEVLELPPVGGAAGLADEPLVVLVDEGPVDHELAGALRGEHQPEAGALVGGGEVGLGGVGVGELLDDRGGVLAGLGVDRRPWRPCRPRCRVEDVAAGALDQRVDPHDVGLVLVGLDADGAVVVGGRVDDLVPRDRLGHVEPGLLGERLAVPEHLGVGPLRERRRPRRPTVTVSAAPASTSSSRTCVGQLALEQLLEPAGVGELGDEDRVEAHQVGGASPWRPAGGRAGCAGRSRWRGAAGSRCRTRRCCSPRPAWSACPSRRG